MRVFLSAILFLLAACATAIPAPPPVTVVVSPVDYRTAVADGVALALTATVQRPAAATETALARLNISLTPSVTPSQTPTPAPPTATFEASPTQRLPASITPSPTFPPYAVNTSDTSGMNGAAGRLRVLNAWIDSTVDVYLNNIRISRALAFAGATPYYQLDAGAVRVTVSTLDMSVSQVVNVPPGGSVSVLAADFGDGLTLRPVYEDVSPLPVGMSRLTVVQGNPIFLRSNVLLPEVERALAYEFDFSEQAGPLDLPSRAYQLAFYDSETPDLLLINLEGLALDNQVNYLLVLLPPADNSIALTDYVLFGGSAPRPNGDIGVQFLNAANQPLSVQLNGRAQLARLEAGDLSVPLPLSPSGQTLTISNGQQQVVAEQAFGETQDNQLVIIHGNEDTGQVEVDAYPQRAIPSLLKSHLRLIHVQPQIAALSLEVRLVRLLAETPETPPAEQPWKPVLDNIAYGEASSYTPFGAELYDVRVTLAGTETVIATLPEVQLLAGGVYDFVVVPGNESGSARLLLAQPDVQAGPALANLDPLVQAQVQATLTAMSPEIVSVVSTETLTPSPTYTPVLTNTPHPTNTPSVGVPTLLVDPAPPQVAQGTFVLLGLNFARRENFEVSLIPGNRRLYQGITDSTGALVAGVILPANMPDGLYIIRVCVGCEPDGPQQESFALINAIFPTPSPAPRFTSTPVPSAPGFAPTPLPAPPPAPPPDEPDEPGEPGEPPPPAPTGIPPTSIPPMPIPPTPVPPTDVPPPPVEPPPAEPPPPPPPVEPPPPEPPPEEPPDGDGG
jgi:hypothetical protein